jgi:effector-binding domain-containing protein
VDFREYDLDVEVAAPIADLLADPSAGRTTGARGGGTAERALSDPPVSVHVLPALPRAATVVYEGPYETIARAYFSLGRWLARTGMRIAGPCREVYMRGPGAAPPEAYVTEIQCPVQTADPAARGEPAG